MIPETSRFWVHFRAPGVLVSWWCRRLSLERGGRGRKKEEGNEEPRERREEERRRIGGTGKGRQGKGGKGEGPRGGGRENRVTLVGLAQETRCMYWIRYRRVPRRGQLVVGPGIFAEKFGASRRIQPTLASDTALAGKSRPAGPAQDTGALLDYSTATHQRCLAWIESALPKRISIGSVLRTWTPPVFARSRLVQHPQRRHAAHRSGRPTSAACCS